MPTKSSVLTGVVAGGATIIFRAATLANAAAGFVIGFVARPVVNVSLKGYTYVGVLNACMNMNGEQMLFDVNP
jgi:hypothetical protein